MKSEPRKANIAMGIIADADFGISVQVLQEFFVNIRRAAPGFTQEDTDAWITDLLEFECVSPDIELFSKAVATSRIFKISYWDSAIITAAAKLGCQTLYTEDLNHGQSYGAVKVINPFLDI